MRDGTEEFTRKREIWIHNNLCDQVERFIIAEENVIFEGNRGCGKTSIANMSAYKHNAIFITITPERDIYECLFFSTIDVSDWVNEIQKCKSLGMEIMKQDEIELYPFKDKVIIIDSPDNLCSRNVNVISDFIDLSIRNDAKNILLFGTSQQIKTLKTHSDVFRKWRTVEFVRPELDFFIELIDKRTNNSNVFTMNAIEKLVTLASYNTRKFLELCSDILVEAKIRELKEVIDIEFIDDYFGKVPVNVFVSRAYPKKIAYLNQVADYYRNKVDWIKLTEALKDLLTFIPVKEGALRKYICRLESVGVLEKRYEGLKPRVKFNKYKS